MTKNEALKLALEALEDLGMKHYESTGEVLHKETFTAIKEALAQPEQEPVGWAEHGVINWLADRQFNHTSFLYETPAQRTWVGLTDEEIKAAIPFKDLSGEYYYDDVLNIILFIQAKLKRKNI